MQFVTEFVFGFLEFLDRLTKTASEFRQFLGPEKNKYDQQNDDQIGAAEVHEAGENAHIQVANIQTRWPNLQGNLGRPLSARFSLTPGIL